MTLWKTPSPGLVGAALALLALLSASLSPQVARGQDVSPAARAPLPGPAPESGAEHDPQAVVFPGGYRLSTLTPSDRLDLGQGATLSLEEVLTSVQRHHPILEAERQRIRAAEGELLAAQGGFDLNLTARGWAAPTGYYDWARAEVRLDQATPIWGASVYAGWRVGGGDIPGYYGGYETLDSGELRAGLSVPLWRDGRIDGRRARLRRAEHGADAQQASLASRTLRTKLGAASAYWSWVAAGLTYGVVAGLLDLAEERDAQLAVRVRTGARPPIDSLENRRVIVARRVSLVSARRRLELSAIRLSLYYRGEDGAPRIPGPDRLPRRLERPAPLARDLQSELSAALDRRPEMARYRALIRRQHVSVDYAENRLAPRVDLSIGASLDLGAGRGTTAVGADRQATLGPAVVEGAVVISLPLQFREARGGVRRSRAELAALRAEARLVRDRIVSEVQDAHSAWRAAEERVALAREAAEVAQAVAQAELRRFELGGTQLFIVNLREGSAAAARATLVDAEAALRIAQAKWDAATGRAEADAH